MITKTLKPGAMTALALLPLLATGAYAQSQTDASGKPLEQIVVTASPITGDPDEFATIVSQVNRDAILQAGGANLADSLADVPGITGSGFAAGASRPVIRGFDATRVKILEDGVGSFDVSDIGPDHGVPIDPLATQSVEVVRGAATLRYGSQAIGGVVNAINNRVPRLLPDKDFSGDLSGSYGTDADTRQGSALLDAKSGQFAFHADGFYRKTDDYDIPGGTQDNSFFKGDGFSLGSSYFFDGDKSRVGGAVSHYDSKYGIPSDTSYIDMKQTKGLFQSSLDLGNGIFKSLNIDAGYADYQHKEIDPDEGPLTTFNNKEWDGRAEGLTGPFGPFSGAALGVQVQHRNFSAIGEDASYLFPTHTQSEAAFAFADSLLVQDLHLQMGARVERVSIHGTPASDVYTERDFTPLSGSVGLLYDLSQAIKLGLTASSTARAPAQTELFARGGHDGPGTYETGDPTLKIERSNSLEGTLRVRKGIFHFDGSLWASHFNHFIYGDLTGLTCDDDGACSVGGGDLKQLFYVQQSAHFWGSEGKGTVTLLSTRSGGTLSAQVLADYVRAKFPGDGDVPRIPPYHVGGGLDWQSSLFDAGFLLKYSGRQNDVGPAETPTKGFVNLDANIAVRPFSQAPGVELAVVGHNLTNETQRDAVAFNKDDVVLPGRDVRFELRAHF
jgi:iron complex outermembrane receptor protein